MVDSNKILARPFSGAPLNTEWSFLSINDDQTLLTPENEVGYTYDKKRPNFYIYMYNEFIKLDIYQDTFQWLTPQIYDQILLHEYQIPIYYRGDMSSPPYYRRISSILTLFHVFWAGFLNANGKFSDTFSDGHIEDPLHPGYVPCLCELVLEMSSTKTRPKKSEILTSRHLC